MTDLEMARARVAFNQAKAAMDHLPLCLPTGPIREEATNANIFLMSAEFLFDQERREAANNG